MLKIVNRSLCLVLLEILSYFPVSLPSPEDGEVVGAAPDRRLPPHHLQSHRAHHLHQLLLPSHLRSDLTQNGELEGRYSDVCCQGKFRRDILSLWLFHYDLSAPKIDSFCTWATFTMPHSEMHKLPLY